ncbi:hypothetical protein [Pseudonocardia halophobica]|nr:hypothetical protein [Pseudonocardia halophobica]
MSPWDAAPRRAWRNAANGAEIEKRRKVPAEVPFARADPAD